MLLYINVRPPRGPSRKFIHRHFIHRQYGKPALSPLPHIRQEPDTRQPPVARGLLARRLLFQHHAAGRRTPHRRAPGAAADGAVPQPGHRRHLPLGRHVPGRTGRQQRHHLRAAHHHARLRGPRRRQTRVVRARPYLPAGQHLPQALRNAHRPRPRLTGLGHDGRHPRQQLQRHVGRHQIQLLPHPCGHRIHPRQRAPLQLGLRRRPRPLRGQRARPLPRAHGHPPPHPRLA